MEDPSKFFNVIIDRTNQKLNSFQAQIIVLESQLQMANDERDAYKKYVDNLPSISHDVEGHNKLKKDYALLEQRYHEALKENAEYIEKIKIIQSDQVNSTQFIRDQNETLLQEIRRLKAEMAEMSTGK
jgi:hypothetical protein